MSRSLLKSLVVSLCFGLSGTAILVLTTGLVHGQPLNVLTVDCNPGMSPGFSAFGPQNTMGQALLAVDQGVDFIVTEVFPPSFRAQTAAQLSTYDVIVINNHPTLLGDNCVAGNGNGLGTTWHTVVGVQQCGGRVVLTSHDAPRFHMNAPAPGPPPRWICWNSP